jgi:mannose-1-phosphate guanylyltransferase
MPSESLPIHAVILAGGRGTRFWPRSRSRTPKQLLEIFGKRTMLEQTVSRLRPLISPYRLWTVTNAEQAVALKKQLPAAARERVLVEPVGRNTAAAIALAAFHIRQAVKGRVSGFALANPELNDALMAVLPADHFIAQPEKYRKLVSAALDVAREPGRMVVLGIPPTHPETGFGYIERRVSGFALANTEPKKSSEPAPANPPSHVGEAYDSAGFPVFAVRQFTEKPALEVAKLYLSSGNFYWNAGMFFWRVSTFLEALKRHLPQTYAALEKLSSFIGSGHYTKQLHAIYPKLENISVDYAILERVTKEEDSAQVFVIPAEIGWSDIGSWGAVYGLQVRAGASDSASNVMLTPGQALDAHGNFVSVPGKFTALIGVSDLVVVETRDALLICPRDRAQDVSALVKSLESQKLKHLL